MRRVLGRCRAAQDSLSKEGFTGAPFRFFGVTGDVFTLPLLGWPVSYLFCLQASQGTAFLVLTPPGPAESLLPGGYILGLRKQGKGMLELLLNGG